MSGLNMSRSLGDKLAHDVGVSSEPEIKLLELQRKKDRSFFLLLGSDGVFEVLSNQESCKIVVDALNTGCNLQEATDALLEATKFKWGQNPTGYCDDISVVVYAL